MFTLAIVLACAQSPRSLPAAGVPIAPDASGIRLGELRAGLVAYGREGSLVPFAAVTPTPEGCVRPAWALGDCLPRLSRPGPGLREHWDLGPAWAEQSFVLDAPPKGQGPVLFDAALTGIDASGRDRGGRRWSVSDALATDANATPLPATLSHTEGGFRIRVDDKNATYPITVDPIYATAWVTSVGSRNDNMGAAARNVGDLTGDGIDDLAVGAAGNNSYRGTVRLFYGGSTLSSTADQHLDGEDSNDYFGAALSRAGDTNGDGYSDIVIGATGRAGVAGAAYVFLGASGGPGPTEIVTWEGAAAGDTMGFAVAGGGDLDADGFDDVAVGAIGVSFNTGLVTVYSGSASGPAPTASATLSPTVSRPRFGGSLLFIPDYDGDGDDELAVGAYGASSFTGQVSVFPGDPAGLATTPAQTLTGANASDTFGWAIDQGDLNGDGAADLVVSSLGADSYTGRADVFFGASGAFSTAPDWTATGSATADMFGQSAAVLGDTDGDGWPELAIGASRPSDFGVVSVFYGPGPESTPDDTFVGSTGSEFGTAVAGGDWDADGFADLAVGAPAGSGGGELWIYRGYADADGDGVGSADDCDDADPTLGERVRRYTDSDGDGFGAGPLQEVCTEQGYAEQPGDCDDTNPEAWPGNTEIDGDGADGDCDGLERCYADADADSYRSDGLIDANDGDCADPGEASEALPGGDCDDTNHYVHPDSVEICDGLDDDCDGTIDGPLSQDATEWQRDGDSDGYTNPEESVVECTAPSGYIAPSELEDCDDTASYINPGVDEVVGDGVDQNCDGSDGADDSGIGGADKDCGCATGEGGAGLLAMGLALLALSRRRG